MSVNTPTATSARRSVRLALLLAAVQVVLVSLIGWLTIGTPGGSGRTTPSAARSDAVPAPGAGPAAGTIGSAPRRAPVAPPRSTGRAHPAALVDPSWPAALSRPADNTRSADTTRPASSSARPAATSPPAPGASPVADAATTGAARCDEFRMRGRAAAAASACGPGERPARNGYDGPRRHGER